MNKFIIVFSLNFLMALFVFGQGQTRVIKHHIINAEEHWSGNILITGDVTVTGTGILQIAPGTHIAFAANSDLNHSGFDKTRAELIIKGTVIAKGAFDRKIIFTSAATSPRMQDWGGIIIMNLKNPAIFEFVVVEYAYNGFDIKKSDPVIKNSQIQFNFNAGLKIAVRSKAKLIGNIIRDNGYAGVICETGAQPVLSDNLITKNQIGLIVFGTAQPNLGNLQKGEGYNSGRNALFDNLQYDVYNHSVKDIKAEGNSWGSNKLEFILTRIYDKKDADRYGAVDFNPIIGNVDLERKMLLAQQPVNIKKDTVQSNVAQNKAESLSLALKKNEKVSPNAPISSLAPKKPIKTAETGKMIPELKDSTQTLAHVDRLKVDSAAKARAHANQFEKKTKKTVEETDSQKVKINFNQIFLDVFLDQKVKVVKKVQPVVGDPSKGMYEHGRVVVRVTVERNGKVNAAKVLRGLNYYYDHLALEAAMKFIFKPGTVKGIPVRFSTSILFKF